MYLHGLPFLAISCNTGSSQVQMRRETRRDMVQVTWCLRQSIGSVVRQVASSKEERNDIGSLEFGMAFQAAFV